MAQSFAKKLLFKLTTYSKPQNVIITALSCCLALPLKPLGKHREKAQSNRSELNDNNLRKLCPILRHYSDNK